MNDWDRIVETVFNRRSERSPLLARMVEVRDRYNGEYVVPIVAEGDDVPLPPLTAQIIADTIDNLAMRAASVMPTIHSPAVAVGRARGPRSTEYAQIRKRALGYTYAESGLQLGLRRGFRQLGGYGSCGFEVIADGDCCEPRVATRDPLGTFPQPKDSGDLSPIEDCAYVYGKTARWVWQHYPRARNVLGNRPNDAQLWDLVEWVDHDDIVIGLLGPQVETSIYGQGAASGKNIELERHPNRAGICPAVSVDRVTLDRLANQLANIIGQTDMMARLQALEVRGVERSIWPDTYLVGRPGETPILLGGSWHEGTSGEVNLMTGVENVGQLRGTPDPRAAQTIDRLERNARVSAGLVPAMGGETYGSLRTGRGIDSMMGAAVDPRIQEMQETMAMILEQINVICLEIYKGYWGNRTYLGYSKWPSDQTTVEFVPNKHFETCASAVKYPIPGADVQSTTVLLGQLYGTKAISLDTFRSQHPYIADAEAEAAQVRVEAIDDAIMASLLQRFTAGGIPPIDQAAMKKLIAKGTPIEDAIEIVDQRARRRQAGQALDAQGPLGAEPALGGDAPPPGMGAQGMPAGMPGLGNPGEGSAAAVGPVPQGAAGIGPPQGLDGFRQLSAALQAPQQDMSGDQMAGSA